MKKLLPIVSVIMIAILLIPQSILAADVTYGTEAEAFNSFTAGEGVFVMEVDTDEFVICSSSAAGATVAGSCKAATVSGTTPSFGSAVEFVGDVAAGLSPQGYSACSLGTDRFAVVYADDALADDGYVRVGTTTGTTLHGFGPALEFETGDMEYPGCTEVATDKIVIGYNDEANSDTGKAVACTVDADEVVTCGTPVDYSTTDYYAKYNSCAKLDTDKFICFWEGEDTDDVFAVAGTVSGTTITMGTPQTVTTDANAFVDVDTIGTDQFVAFWQDGTNGGGDAVAGTVSGTTITFSSLENMPSGVSSTTNETSIVLVDSTTAVAAWNDPGNPNAWSSKCTVNFATPSISCAAREQYFGGTADGTSLALISSNKIALGYVHESDDDVYTIVGTLAGAANTANTTVEGDIIISGDLIID